VTCGGCGKACQGRMCKPCELAERLALAEQRARRCGCGARLAKGTKGERCRECRYTVASAVFEETAKVAPAIPPVPQVQGSAVIVTDIHAPWHDPAVLRKVCEAGALLGVRQLIIGGDLFHADTISKYIGVAKSIPIVEELHQCRKVLDALELFFDRIVVIPGNHDQRFERMLALCKDSSGGRKALDLLAALLDVDKDDTEALSESYLSRFLCSPRIELYPLPQLVLNGAWLIQHPGTCSRTAAATERGMIAKHRMSVVQGHNHLFGVTFDASGQDIAFNCGHASNETKFRYMREKPGTFPAMVKGFGVVLVDDAHPTGYLVPLAVHDKWFDLGALAQRLQGAA
jgi:hypothetical protein